MPHILDIDRPFVDGVNSDDNLSLRIERSFDGLDSIQPVWDAAVERLGGSVYMTYDWCRLWWEFYGKDKELRLFLFSIKDELVAILPIYIDALGWGPLKVRTARLVGSNIPPKVFNPPTEPASAPAVFIRVLQQLFLQDGCDVLSFGPFSELCAGAALLAEVGASFPQVLPPRIESGVHSIFWLPSGMEEYYASLSKNERKHRRKYELRLLRKEFDVRVEVLSDPEQVSGELDRFIKQHAAQWECEGKPGHFGAWPRAADFNRALVRAEGRHGRVRFIRILANEQVIANEYAFSFGGCLYWELPSRVAGDQWERFSLGPTGIVTMINQGIQEGLKRIEGGLAHYDYKLRLGAREHNTLVVRLLARRGRFKVTALLGFRKLIQVLYHKIWYRRLAPYFPRWISRMQWMFWLRLDF